MQICPNLDLSMDLEDTEISVKKSGMQLMIDSKNPENKDTRSHKLQILANWSCTHFLFLAASCLVAPQQIICLQTEHEIRYFVIRRFDLALVPSGFSTGNSQSLGSNLGSLPKRDMWIDEDRTAYNLICR